MAGPSAQGVPFLQMVLPKARGLDKPQPEGGLAGGEAASQVCGVLWARVDSWSCELCPSALQSLCHRPKACSVMCTFRTACWQKLRPLF